MATLMILVTGPYRGGTNDDPVLIGASSGADQMVETGKAHGKKIFYSIDEITAP